MYMMNMTAVSEGLQNTVSVIETTEHQTIPRMVFYEAKKNERARIRMSSLKKLIVRLEKQSEIIDEKFREQGTNEKKQKTSKNFHDTISQLKAFANAHDKIGFTFLTRLSGLLTNASPQHDGKLWATTLSTNNTNSLLLINPMKGSPELTVLSSPPSLVTCLCATKENVWVGTVGTDLYVYDLNIPTKQPIVVRGHTIGPITSLVVCGTLSSQLSQIKESKKRQTENGGNVSFSKSRVTEVLLSSSADLSIIIWSIKRRQCLHTLRSLTDPILSMFSVSFESVWIATTRGIHQMKTLELFRIVPIDSVRFIHSANITTEKVKQLPSSTSPLMTPKQERIEKKKKKKSKHHKHHNETSDAHTHAVDLSGSEDSDKEIATKDENEIDRTDERNGLKRSSSFSTVSTLSPNTSPQREVPWSVRSLCVVNSEVWGVTRDHLIIWDSEKLCRLYTIEHSLVNSIVCVGLFVYTFSHLGISRWDIKTHKIVERITTEPSYYGTLVFQSNTNKYVLFCVLCNGSIHTIDTEYTSHTLVPTTYSSPRQCNVCAHALWTGTRTRKHVGLSCERCGDIHVHNECAHLLDAYSALLLCNGDLKAKKAKAFFKNASEKKRTSSLAMFDSRNGNASNRPSAAAIAKSLFAIKHSIDSTELGDWLGSQGNDEVIKEWVKLLDIKTLNFEMALRRFLRSFSLPGESQKIDRLMQGFADVYYEYANDLFNPPLFGSTNACYALSFSCIMMNTSLHNPDSSNRLTLDLWIASNSGLNLSHSGEENNFGRDFLSHLYSQIKSFPFEFFSTDTSPIMQGYLTFKEKPTYALIQNDIFVLSKKPNSEPMETYKLNELSVLELDNKNSMVLITPNSRIILTSQCQFTIIVWLFSFRTNGAKTVK